MNTNYSRRAIDPDILSILDITASGKVVTAEHWVKLWTLVFDHINELSEYVTTLDELQTNWETSKAQLDNVIAEFLVKYNALSQSFVHYGNEAPNNEHIKVWIRPVAGSDVNNILVTQGQLYSALYLKADKATVALAFEQARAEAQGYADTVNQTLTDIEAEQRDLTDRLTAVETMLTDISTVLGGI